MTTTAPETAAATGLPLFYRTPVVLRFEEHRRAALGRTGTFEFTREAAAVPLMIGEFMPAICHHPIVFADAERLIPLAVPGLKQGRNLFLEDDGPGAATPMCRPMSAAIPSSSPRRPTPIPGYSASTRRRIASSEPPEEDRRRAAVESGGGPTQATRAAVEFCQAMHEDHLRTVAFADVLRGAELLTANRPRSPPRTASATRSTASAPSTRRPPGARCRQARRAAQGRLARSRLAAPRLAAQLADPARPQRPGEAPGVAN